MQQKRRLFNLNVRANNGTEKNHETRFLLNFIFVNFCGVVRLYNIKTSFSGFWLRAYVTTEDKRDNFRRQFSFGTGGGIHSIIGEPHANSLWISKQNVQHKNGEG